MTDTLTQRARDVAGRLNERLGGVTSPVMQGDNLAILLCGIYDNPDQEPESDDDCGWTPDAIAGQEEVLNAIRAHYAPLAAIISELVERIEGLEREAMIDKGSAKMRVIGERLVTSYQSELDRINAPSVLGKQEGEG